jgi:hypothetical protein
MFNGLQATHILNYSFAFSVAFWGFLFPYFFAFFEGMRGESNFLSHLPVCCLREVNFEE